MGRSAALVRLLQRAKSVAPDALPESEAGTDAAESVAGERSDVVVDSAAMPNADGEAPAQDGDAGIASIFATIRTGGGDLTQDELPEDTGATYALLSRLDQLWQAPGHSEG